MASGHRDNRLHSHPPRPRTRVSMIWGVRIRTCSSSITSLHRQKEPRLSQTGTELAFSRVACEATAVELQRAGSKSEIPSTEPSRARRHTKPPSSAIASACVRNAVPKSTKAGKLDEEMEGENEVELEAELQQRLAAEAAAQDDHSKEGYVERHGVLKVPGETHAATEATTPPKRPPQWPQPSDGASEGHGVRAAPSNREATERRGVGRRPRTRLRRLATLQGGEKSPAVLIATPAQSRKGTKYQEGQTARRKSQRHPRRSQLIDELPP